MIDYDYTPKPKRIERARHKCTRIAIFAVATYSAIASTTGSAVRMTWGSGNHNLEGELSDISQLVINQSNLLGEYEMRLAKAKLKLSIFRSVSDHPDWSILMAMVGSQITDENQISLFKLEKRITAETSQAKNSRSNESYQVSIQGKSGSLKGISQFLINLEQLGIFKQVKLLETKGLETDENIAVQYSILCSIEPFKSKE